ncbi:ABC transporter ATP-binding protein [Polynucleobacter sp. Latsch14-2]|uniref:ABC transporter ATP-binding protein n=1 Tax=Polynucleobacter sp. Latsch14-2 TaxID=2576920 RepID=UPI001C0E0B28|nr:ABC transporter ATP-binding protein [Polynucleobacter sp. Latsch14-2]
MFNNTKSNDQKQIFELLSTLWGYVDRRRRNQFLYLFLLMILASFAEIISIGAVIPFLGVLTSPEKIFLNDNFSSYLRWFEIDQASELLLPVTIIFCISALLSGVIRLILLWMTMRLSFATGADLGIQIYRRTLYQPYAVHVSRNSSEIISGITNKSTAVMHQILSPVLLILTATLMILMVIVALFLIQPIVSLASFFGFGIIYLGIYVLTKTRLERNSRLIAKDSTQVIKSLQEGLGGIRDVLIDGSQEAYMRSYEAADLSLRSAQASNQFISNSPKFIMESMGMALIALIAFGISSRGNNLLGAIPLLGAMALAAQRILPLMQQFYNSWTTIKGSKDVLVDVLHLLAQLIPDNQAKALHTYVEFKKEITLDGVFYRYGETGPWIIQNVSLKIKKGSRVGFIGATGSGKSTLIDICMALLTPNIGQLKVDGQAITPINSRSWQDKIAHVPQSIYLADCTIAENIAFGIPKSMIDFSRVRLAAAKAQIAETIESWDGGYSTLVGERGVRLSGGQRQRIGIARALYRRAEIIIFDEATSALDGDTEASVMSAIDGLGSDLTVLIIAHRLSTLSGCTKVLEMSRGELLRECSYQQIKN